MRAGREYVEFQDSTQLHCTHLTLRRSDPRGPAAATDLLKPGRSLDEVRAFISRVTRKLEPIEVELQRVRVRGDGLAIIAFGQCVDERSSRSRRILIGQLREGLSELCNLSLRGWDTDSSKYHLVHCALGFLKRPVSQNFESFAVDTVALKVKISFTFREISLVHHRHRTLLFPQEGCVNFPLGKEMSGCASEFEKSLNLAHI